jgi:hypothetical protein
MTERMTGPGVELLQVIIGACGCVLPADTLPVGFRFVATATGDKRVLVYCCPEHDLTKAHRVVGKKKA